MEKPLLNDPDLYPEKDILSHALGNTYPVFQSLLTTITGEPLMLQPAWRYYKDGMAWLCKVTHKNKTVFWLSVWDGFFKITFYFTEKTGSGINDLGIDQKLLKNFQKSEPIGKLIPLSIAVSREDQIGDVLKIAVHKMKLV